MTSDPALLSSAMSLQRGPAGERRRRPITGAIATCALLIGAVAGGSAEAARLLHLRCINTASEASWPIVIDLDRGLVGSVPATITDKRISWRDPQQGFFDLDRATGKLEFRNASSTGGYFLHYTCRPE